MDERAKRTGGYIELLGTYNPLTEPKDIKLKQERIDYWTKQGAQMSDGYLRMIGKAPQRPPRKPKKEKVSKVSEGEAKTEEKPAEETAQPNTSDGGSVSEAKADSSEVSATEAVTKNEIATEPTAPRNDEEKESEKKNEGSA